MRGSMKIAMNMQYSIQTAQNDFKHLKSEIQSTSKQIDTYLSQNKTEALENREKSTHSVSVVSLLRFF